MKRQGLPFIRRVAGLFESLAFRAYIDQQIPTFAFCPSVARGRGELHVEPVYLFRSARSSVG